MKKTKLKISPSENDENKLLFSIITSESDLQLCMMINQLLGISLALAEDVVVKRKSRILIFRKYVYENEDLLEKYILFSNYSDGEYLFPELKKNDYLLLIITESVTFLIENRIKQLKDLPPISGIFRIEASNIKSLNKIKI